MKRSAYTLSRPALSGTLVSICLALAGCSSDDDDAAGTVPNDPVSAICDHDNPPFSDATEPASYAFLSSVPPDFSAGQIERLTLGSSIACSGTLPADTSDIRVRTDGSSVYQLGRFQLDSISKFDPVTLALDYQFSALNGSPESTNPQDLVFVSDTKAYLLEYGTSRILIVNPQATSEAEFFTGELDLSAYGAVPRAIDAEIVGDKLFVVLQRLNDDFRPVDPGYVAVFDTNDDTEIDTAPAIDGLPGIELGTGNPFSIQYLSDTDELYITSGGWIYAADEAPGDPYTGGIEALDPNTYTLDLLVDDGTAEDNQGFFSASLVVSAERGYLLSYAAFGVSSLRSFDPRTGLLDESPVAGLEALDLSVLQQDTSGRVWVGVNGDAPGFTLIDPTDNELILDKVPTALNPTSLTFIDVPGSSAP